MEESTSVVHLKNVYWSWASAIRWQLPTFRRSMATWSDWTGPSQTWPGSCWITWWSIRVEKWLKSSGLHATSATAFSLRSGMQTADHFGIFGSRVFPQAGQKVPGKLDRRAKESTLVVYCWGNEYGIPLFHRKTVLVSKDLKVCENDKQQMVSI